MGEEEGCVDHSTDLRRGVAHHTSRLGRLGRSGHRSLLGGLATKPTLGLDLRIGLGLLHVLVVVAAGGAVDLLLVDDVAGELVETDLMGDALAALLVLGTGVVTAEQGVS